MDRRKFISRAMITGAAAYAATPPLSLLAESPSNAPSTKTSSGTSQRNTTRR